MKKRPMVLIFTGILSGMAVAWNFMSMTTAFYMLIEICFIVVLISGDKRYILVIISAFLGIGLAAFSRISMNLDIDQVYKDKTDLWQGKVIEISKTKKDKQAILLERDELEGKILLYTSSNKNIKPGNQLSVNSRLEVFEEATNPGQFSSRHYYFSKGIYYHAYAKEIKIIEGKSSFWGKTVLSCRSYLNEQLKNQYKKEVQNFLKGMILGDKRELSDEIKDDFKESGLIHLLAVSGLHISLAGRSLYKLLRKISGNFILCSIFGMLTAIYYCILTGMSVSSIRALIMLGIYFLSEITGEHYDLLSAASFCRNLIACSLSVSDL